MRYVIEFTDGSFNQGAGFPCRLEEATLYGSRSEAEGVAEELCDVFAVTEYVEPTPPTVFTIEQLADAIEQATIELNVCEPSNDFYRRADEWTENRISIIDPHVLLRILRGEA